MQFDVQGSYRLYKGVQVVATGLNLSNEVFGFYTGSKIYPNQREYYKPTVMLGLRWTSSVEWHELQRAERNLGPVLMRRLRDGRKGI
jgi:hypothetical protein